jgi:thioredoxin 1
MALCRRTRLDCPESGAYLQISDGSKEIPMASANVTHVTDASFEQDVMKSDKPVLIDFWAPWCAPCRAIAPIVDELADQYAGRLKVVKINVDDNPNIPMRVNVRGIPNLLIIRDGQVKNQLVGAVPANNLVKAVDSAIA